MKMTVSSRENETQILLVSVCFEVNEYASVLAFINLFFGHEILNFRVNWPKMVELRGLFSVNCQQGCLLKMYKTCPLISVFDVLNKFGR